MSEFDFEKQNESMTSEKAQTQMPKGTVGVIEGGFDDDIQFVEKENYNREDDRYVFFAGNVMSDDLRLSRPGLHLGGEYFGHDYPGLRITMHSVMRGRITPLALQPRPVSKDELISNREVENFNKQILGVPEEAAPRLAYVKAFPGDQCQAIVYGKRDGKTKGIVELEVLKGEKWAKEETKRYIFELQNKFFPNWMKILRGDDENFKLPETLRELEAIIFETGEKYATDQTVRAVVKDMLKSCSQFRLYGIGYLESEATRIRAGVGTRGYVHRYSPEADVLLRQLEMRRENLSQNYQPPAPAGDNNRMADALLESAAANRELVQEFINERREMAKAAKAGEGKPSGEKGGKPKDKTTETGNQQ